MERLLLLWDDLDDIICACRHVAASAVEEVATVSAPLVSAVSAGFSAMLLWLSMPR